MTIPTPGEIAAQLRTLADQVAALGAAVPGKPSKPRVTQTATNLLLKVDADPAATKWRWRDELDAANSVKGETSVPWTARSPMKATSRPRRYSVQAGNAAGWSDWSDAVDVPETGEPVPDPEPQPGGKLPTDVLPILKTWTVMTTTGEPGKPTNTYPVKHGDGRGFIPGVFYVAPDNGVMYHATVDGVTSPNSSRCRVEARQMADDKWTKAAWNGNDPHTLEADLWISTAGLQKRKQVSALQIHDGGDDVLQVLADAEQGLIVKTDDGQTIAVLDPDYQDKQRCTVRITTGGGKVQVFYYGHTGAPKVVEFNKTGTSWYFKAGAYLQASMAEHGEPPTSFGEVCIYILRTSGKLVG